MWPSPGRAHARRLEHLPKIGSLIRGREDHGALVLRHPPRMAQVDGNAQTMLLRRKPVRGYQERVLTIRWNEKDARVGELVLTSPEPAWTEGCFFVGLRPVHSRPSAASKREQDREVVNTVCGPERC
jgi:hypothetical protein